MNQKTTMVEQKSTRIKFAFLLLLLICAFCMYLESHMLIDAAYCAVVFVIFIRFIIIKLYP